MYMGTTYIAYTLYGYYIYIYIYIYNILSTDVIE